MRKVLTFTDRNTLFRELCSLIDEAAYNAIKERDSFSMALSGGKSPRALYEALSSSYREGIDWSSVRIFWGDERFVSEDHPESNYRMAEEFLIGRVPIPHENVYPVPTVERTATRAAEAYEKVLKKYFSGDTLPRFDLILLGMGKDGHVASLFSGSAALEETSRWVVAAEAPESYAVRERITVTIPVINSAVTVVLLVTGPDKREILQNYMRNEGRYPANLVKPSGRFFVFTDIKL
jgi:6-phosphogluconolactonase